MLYSLYVKLKQLIEKPLWLLNVSATNCKEYKDETVILGGQRGMSKCSTLLTGAGKLSIPQHT